MGKSHETARESRKKPQKTLKERRAEKRMKKMDKTFGEVHVE
jgi:hypothetical protein